MERLLFLDIDGVINTHMIYSEPIEGRRMVEKDGFYFDLCWPNDGRVSNEYAVRWLNKLCLEYNLQIVITSTWLIGHKIAEIEKCLRNSGLDSRIHVFGGTTTNYFKTRGVQIEAWMNSYEYNIDKTVFIILDDDTDMVGFKRDLTPYLVKCDTYTGFNMREYSQACTLLDKLIEEREDNGKKKE